MLLLALENASLAYGHNDLLNQARFQLESGERVALIGRNGSGKSSLMRVLAGATTLDDGNFWQQAGIRVAYVPQEADFALEGDVFDAVSSALGESAQLLQDLHAATLDLERDHSAAALERLGAIQQAIEDADAWRLNQRVESTLSQLHIDGNAALATLSGGALKRVALARALVLAPEVLLLDEPTNHLDIDSIVWLEALIRDSNAASVIITHDRAFLENIATRIVALDRGQLASYPGSFSAWQNRKAQELEAEQKAAARFDKLLAQEEVWIRKGIEARRTRNEGRVRRLQALRAQRAQRQSQPGQVQLRLDRGEEGGRMIAELEAVSKSFDQRCVIRDFSARILRGERIGIVGPNGAGKTTLLKLILGKIKPDSGHVRQGTRQSIAYFDQMRTQLAEELPLTEVISPGADHIQIGKERKHVISYLGDFLFPPARARSPVSSLSGGERNRLLLARLFAQPANILVLDEPTNDLDIETLDLLEERLLDYDGTLFVVSHDRRFLDQVTTSLIAAEGNGHWREHVGGYSEWQAWQQKRDQADKEKAAAKAAPAAATAAPPPTNTRNTLSWKEKRELEALPDQIGTLEAEQSALHNRLADPALYSEAPEQATELTRQLGELEQAITRAMERWEALETRAADSQN